MLDCQQVITTRVKFLDRRAQYDALGIRKSSRGLFKELRIPERMERRILASNRERRFSIQINLRREEDLLSGPIEH